MRWWLALTFSLFAISARADGLSQYGCLTIAGKVVCLGGSQTLASTDLTDTASLARSSNNLSFFSSTTSAQLAGVISDETGSGALVFANTPTLITPAIGAATGTSLVLSGQASASVLAPTASTCAGTYFNLSGTNTLGGCINSVLGVEWAPGGEKIHINGSTSNSPLLLDGTILTGGTGTTNFPAVLIQPSGTTAVTTWSTSGCGYCANMPSGFAGRFFDFRVAGGSSLSSLASNGDFVANNITTSSGSLITFGSRSRISSPADGVLLWQNNGQTSFTCAKAGGTTSSFGALCFSGTTMKSQLADQSADAPFTASNGIFSGYGMFGSGTALTLSAGEVGYAKITASGSAPGAAGAKEEWVCGTNAGSAKKIAYAGTSTTPVTVVDNVGSGVTGC